MQAILERRTALNYAHGHPVYIIAAVNGMTAPAAVAAINRGVDKLLAKARKAGANKKAGE